MGAQWKARERQSTPDLARHEIIPSIPWQDRIVHTFCMVLLRKSLRTMSVMSGLVLPMYSSLRDGAQTDAKETQNQPHHQAVSRGAEVVVRVYGVRRQWFA